MTGTDWAVPIGLALEAAAWTHLPEQRGYPAMGWERPLVLHPEPFTAYHLRQ